MSVAQRICGADADNKFLCGSLTALSVTGSADTWGTEVEIYDGSGLDGGSGFQISMLYIRHVEQANCPTILEFRNYVMGTEVDCQFSIVGNTVDKVGHGLANNDKVILTDVNLTTGIDTRTLYYVVSRNDNDFQLSLTRGGGAVDMTVSDGTGAYSSLGTTTVDGAASRQDLIHSDAVFSTTTDVNDSGRHIENGRVPDDNHISVRAKATGLSNAIEFFLGLRIYAG